MFRVTKKRDHYSNEIVWTKQTSLLIKKTLGRVNSKAGTEDVFPTLAEV